MWNELLALARPEIVAMNSYRSARSEALEGSIWLDANENPSADGLYNRYPEPQPYSLVSQLATVYGVTPDQILVTRGIDEGIDLLLRLFCRAGADKIMICPPTYGMYKVAATLQGATIVEVPLLKEQNFSLNVSNILKVWNPSIKLVFLCSPNNPTGNLLAEQSIFSILKKVDKKSIVIVDEAYIEFSRGSSLVRYLNDYPHLVILRTLSKAYGMAGIRCGATLANPGIIQLLKKIISPYPIPKPIVEIASERLSLNAMEDQIKIIRQARDRLFSFLSNLSSVKKVWESDANFLLFEAENSQATLKACINNGIVLRDRSHEYHLNDCIRATIGTSYENTFLMEVLARV